MIPLATALVATPGLHELVLDLEGAPRRFTLLVPAHPAGAPVVVALHYAGHGAPHYATGYVDALVGPALASTGAIVLAPDCPGKSWTEDVSERVVLGLLDRVVADLGADPRRVTLTGYSMGGIGAWWLASRHPERFARVVPMASRPPRGVTGVSVQVRAIHAVRDELMPIAEVRSVVAASRAEGRDAELLELPGIGHYDTAACVEALRSVGLP